MARRALPALLALIAFVADLSGSHGVALALVLGSIPPAFALALECYGDALEARCGGFRPLSAAGGLGLLSGYAALSVTKGAALHRKIGMLFVCAMLTLAVTGMLIWNVPSTRRQRIRSRCPPVVCVAAASSRTGPVPAVGPWPLAFVHRRPTWRDAHRNGPSFHVAPYGMIRAPGSLVESPAHVTTARPVAPSVNPNPQSRLHPRGRAGRGRRC